MLLLVLLTGCATGGSVPSATRPIAPGEATISITRSKEFVASLATATVELNGAKFASLGNGESFTGGIPPGPVVLSATTWDAIGATRYSFTAQRGKTYRFVVEPRGENIAAGVIGGVVGLAIEGGGPFSIKPVN